MAILTDVVSIIGIGMTLGITLYVNAKLVKQRVQTRQDKILIETSSPILDPKEVGDAIAPPAVSASLNK